MARSCALVLLGTLACAPDLPPSGTGTSTGDASSTSTGDVTDTDPAPTTSAAPPPACDEICDDPKTVDFLMVTPDTDPSALHCVRSVGQIFIQNFTGPLPFELRSLQEADSVLFFNNHELTDLAGLECLRHVGHMVFDSNLALTDITALAGLESLGSLGMVHHPALADLSPLDGIPGLGALSMNDNAALTVLPRLLPGTEVGSLEIRSCDTLQDLGPLADARLRGDAHVVLSDLPALTSIADLAEVWPAASDDLSVEMYELPQLTALTGLELSDRVDVLTLRSLPGVASLAPLAPLRHVRALTLSSLPGASLAPLAQLREVDVLALDQLPAVTLSDLGALEEVGTLQIGTCQSGDHGLDGIVDLAGLDALAELTTLRLGSNDQLASLAGLDALVTGPMYFDAVDNPMLSKDAVIDFVLAHDVADGCHEPLHMVCDCMF